MAAILARFLTDKVNAVGQPYASGWGFMPLTISEGVCTNASAEEQLFFATSLMGSILTFMSWHTYKMTNVYTGDERCVVLRMRWTTIRQYLAPLGMIVAGCVSYKSGIGLTPSDAIAKVIHGIGANAAFFGLWCSELKILNAFGWSGGTPSLVITGTERKMRVGFALGFIVCFTIFSCSYAAASMYPDVSCRDKYGTIERSQTYISQSGNKGSSKVFELFVEDTASGIVLLLKTLCFTGEVMLLPCICGTQFTVWYFHRLVQPEEPDDEASLPESSEVEGNRA